MNRTMLLRASSVGLGAALALGGAGGIGRSALHAHATVVAVFTAHYTSATVEVDPVFGEAVGTLVCGGATVGGACFNLVPFAGLSEITQVTPDGATDTTTTTLFQGYDLNHDNCVRCFPNDGDLGWESEANGVIGAPIPFAPDPLQVFVRTVSLGDGGTFLHSTSGTITVTVLTNDEFQARCGGTQGECGHEFQFSQACAPGDKQCEDLPYPYPSKP